MENNDITLEGTSATWRMLPTNGQLGGTYTGTFQFRTFLDPIRRLQAGKEYREFLGPNAKFATETEGNLAFALTQLKYRVLKCPPFWSSTEQESGISGNIGDMNIIMDVLDAAMRAERMYEDKVLKEREEILEKTIKRAEEIQAVEKGEES